MREAKAWVRESDRSKKQKRRAEDKLWEVIYEDPHADPPYKQRTKGGFKGSKKAAQDWANEHKAKTRRNEYIDPRAQAVTFGAFAEKWLATKSKRLNTMRSYERIVTGPKSPLNMKFGRVPLGDISHKAVSEWVAEMVQQGKAPQTVRNQFFVMRAVLTYAVRCDLLLKNPALGVDLPAQRKSWHSEEERYPLTPSEVERIIGKLDDRTEAMFARLAAATGLRPEEVVGLRLCDVDADEGTVFVDGVVVPYKGELIREDKLAKNDHSRRLIDLDTQTLRKLREYINEHRKLALAWFSEHPEHEHPGEALPLFTDADDFTSPFRFSRFSAGSWHRAVKAAGLPRLRFYDLRHAHASLLVGRLGRDGAMDLAEIQQRLGHHSKVMTLDRYSHAGKRDKDKMRGALDAALTSDKERGNVTPITRNG